MTGDCRVQRPNVASASPYVTPAKAEVWRTDVALVFPTSAREGGGPENRRCFGTPALSRAKARVQESRGPT